MFLYRLALELGEEDPDALAERMPLSRLLGWLAYYQMEPFGDDWRRSGRLSSIVAAGFGVKVTGEMEDLFMPGGGRYRGMSQTEIEMVEELKKIDSYRESWDRRK